MPYADPERQRRYQREWMARHRADWFANKTCVDCGTVDDLELDHADSKNKISHAIWSWSAARREQELAKCVARCRPCHVTKTLRQKEYAFGERNGHSSFTEAEIRYIRTSSLSVTELARQFGVHVPTISKIQKRQRWTHVV